MKSKSLPLTAIMAALTATGFIFTNLASANELAEEAQQTPRGSLDALQKLVVEGSHVDLNWNISYPVHNFNETDTEVTVRFITCAIGPKHKIQFGTRPEGESYQEFYHGFSEEHESYALSPDTIISRTFLSANTEIEFLVKHAASRISGKWVSSLNPVHDQQIIEVLDGEPVPDVAPVPGQRSVTDILAPYSENGFIKIGPNQKILLFEVYTDDLNHFGFDLQDLVLLVTHEQIEISQ